MTLQVCRQKITMIETEMDWIDIIEYGQVIFEMLVHVWSQHKKLWLLLRKHLLFNELLGEERHCGNKVVNDHSQSLNLELLIQSPI